ncbi:hypothetical protein NKI56_28160 [Mesorhizobium sp. M0622]
MLAKEAFRSDPKLLLPERLGLHNKHVVTKPSLEVDTEFLRLEYNDPKTIIPDLYVRAHGYDLFVEVAVTHFADDAKIRRLREHKIPAVEIDLSKLPRDSLRVAIVEAVLKTARRPFSSRHRHCARAAGCRRDRMARGTRQGSCRHRGWSAPSQARRALIMVAVARICANENSIIQWTCYYACRAGW